MSLSEHGDSKLSALIEHLYEAAIDSALWPGTASRIAEAFGSISTVVKLHTNGAQVNLLECTDNLVVSEREQAWANEWHRRDLWVERSVACGMSCVITDEHLVTREEQLHSGFYQEWLCHLGIYHMLGAVFPAGDGAIGVLGIHRAQSAGTYDSTERQRAAFLLPHLQRALRLGQRFTAVSYQHAAALQALDRLDTGVLLVDSTCRIILASAMAETLLRDNPELTVKGGRLLTQHRALQSLVLAATDTAQVRMTNVGAVLSIVRPHRLPLTLEVAPLRPSTSMFGEQRPAALVFIRDPETPISVAHLRELFGLTRAEGAVAAALGQGSSLDEIAVMMGVGLATVRSHLKRILAKTGTHRQGEVVALLGRSLSTLPALQKA